MDGNEVMITSSFLERFFSHIFSHIGWSKFYKRHIIVEPVCYIERVGNKLMGCCSIDELIYKSNSVGKITSEIIDIESSDFIEQAMVHDLLEKKEYVLICDNPILFPYERIPKFIECLKVDYKIVPKVAGIVHYHIDERALNENDVKTLQYFTKRIIEMGGRSQIGLVISQQDPTASFKLLSAGESEFIRFLFDEVRDNKITVSGKMFFQERVEELHITTEI